MERFGIQICTRGQEGWGDAGQVDRIILQRDYRREGRGPLRSSCTCASRRAWRRSAGRCRTGTAAPAPPPGTPSAPPRLRRRPPTPAATRTAPCADIAPLLTDRRTSLEPPSVRDEAIAGGGTEQSSAEEDVSRARAPSSRRRIARTTRPSWEASVITPHDATCNKKNYTTKSL